MMINRAALHEPMIPREVLGVQHFATVMNHFARCMLPIRVIYGPICQEKGEALRNSIDFSPRINAHAYVSTSRNVGTLPSRATRFACHRLLGPRDSDDSAHRTHRLQYRWIEPWAALRRSMRKACNSSSRPINAVDSMSAPAQRIAIIDAENSGTGHRTAFTIMKLRGPQR